MSGYDLEGITPDPPSGGGGGGDASAANQVTGNAALSTINLSTDGLETLQAAANTSLAAINANTDGIESLQGTGNTSLAALVAALIVTNAAVAAIVTATDGLEALQTTGNASLAAMKAATSTGTSGFAAISGDATNIVKASPGRLYGLVVTNENATVRYVQLHDKTVVPVNPDVPIMSIPVPAGTAAAPTVLVLGTDFFGPAGLTFAVGIAVGVSSAKATFVQPTDADHQIAATFI